MKQHQTVDCQPWRAERSTAICRIIARQLWIWVVTVTLLVGASLAQESAVPSSGTGIQAAAVSEASLEPVTNNRAISRAVQLVRQGGPMMFPLGVSSFILFLFIFERAISLRSGRVVPRPFVKKFLEQVQAGTLDPREALELCEENRSPIAEVFAACVKKWDRPSVEVEQAIIDSGERVAANLRKYLRLFNGIATTSPLFGLLGTVTGMIHAFNIIANSDAMGRPEMLAGGIGEALITTAAGLIIAIPATIAYMYFTGRVDRLIGEIDSFGQELVGEIASDGWKQRTGRRANKAKASAA